MLIKNKLVVLVGNIGSGKSTVCKQFVEDGYVVISRDSLRYMIGGGKYVFNRLLEPLVYKSEISILRSFLLGGINIILDETGIDRKMRKGYLQLVKELGVNYKVVALVLPRLSMEESVSRRMNDPHQTPDRKVWEEVWKKFDMRYDEPTLEEGFDEVVKLNRSDCLEVTHRI